MRIARARREQMAELTGVHGGAGSILFMSLWDAADFDTPWAFVHAAILLPGGGIGHHRHDDSEEIFITVDNASQFTHNGRTAQVEGGAAVPLRCGETHAIYNHTEHETRWFNVHVTLPEGQPRSVDLGDTRVGVPLEGVDRLPVGRLDRTALRRRQTHGGRGEVRSRLVWEAPDFRTNLGGLAHCVLPPGSSIGYHRHAGVEECYLVIHGSGRLTVEDETEVVQQWDTAPIAMGERHGLYNHTGEELELLVVAVCTVRGRCDAADLGDDLGTR